MLQLKLPPVGPAYPNTWYYARAAGVSKEDEIKTWDAIKASQKFWRDLPAYPGTRSFLETLREQWYWEVYFITNRMGMAPKRQTETWLNSYGYNHPTVLISVDKAKGKICQALDLTHYIDDKPENVLDVLRDSPTTNITLMRRPWNTGMTRIENVPVVNDANEFLQLVQESERI